MLFIHFKSIFSFKFYHRLVQLSALQTALFLCYLFALCALVLFFYTGSVLKTNLPLFLKNFPQVTFENGTLTAPETPVVAPVPGTDFKIVFDAKAQLPPSNTELLQTNTLAWVHGNQLYIPSASGLQTKTLPNNLNFTSDPQTIEKYKTSLSISLRIALFITALLMIGLFLLGDFCLTLGMVLLFNILRARPYSRGPLIKMAVFLLGPLCTLFLARLWISIPLFALAQVIVCIIYVQQIFNSLPEKQSHEN